MIPLHVSSISIWDGQYKKSSKISGQEVPEMKTLAAWLEKNVLSSSPSPDTGGLIKTSAGNYTVIDTAKSRKMCLTHGDFRLDNIVFDTEIPSKILAVLDWELSCVGDPMMDLTYYCIGHHLPAVGILKKVTLLGRGDNNNKNNNNDKDDNNENNSSNKSSNSMNIPVGIPLERDIATIYTTHSAALTLRDQPTINTDDNTWMFFLALGLFRAASIASGVYARSKQGNASSTGAVAYRDIVSILSTKALEIVRTSSDSTLSSSHSHDIVKNTTESSDPPCIMSREPSEQCRALLKKLKHFNDTVAIPAEQQLIEHYMQAEGKWPNRYLRLYDDSMFYCNMLWYLII
jgi:Phosphotransferase enzyme family